jgi:hypothetical protein
MYSWRNFKHKFAKYGKPEPKEVRGLLITTVVFAFIISFRDWGTETFSAALGFQNFILSIILVAIVLAVRELAHRSFALTQGYRSQFRTWIPGLLVGLVLTFLSNGYLPVMLMGGVIVTHMKIHRLGKFFHEFNMKDAGWIAMSGPIACTIFAILMKPFAGTFLGYKLMMLAIWIAIFDMLPIPPMNGLRTFFGSRFIYIFVYSSIISCGLLLTYLSGIASLIFAIVIGIIMLLIFFTQVDKRW